MNYKNIRYILSLVMRIEGICMILPLFCSLIYEEQGSSVVWLVCIALCVAIALLLCIKPPADKTMYSKDGFVTVALSWLLLSIFGAFPFVFTEAVPSFTDAFFETVSGFTTTGASVISDIDSLPRSLVFWRSFTHWIGGMGVLVFLVALVPISGGSNFYLVKAESTGPAVSKLVPKIKSTAKILYGIYIAFTFIEFLLLLCGGMEIFDAITITFGTVGTGGFSVRNSGMNDYSSFCQIVITVFMIMCGVDFGFYHMLILRKFRTAVKSEEVRAYFSVIIVSAAVIALNCRPLFGSLFETVKHSAFQVGSIITTTGYSTVDYDKWPQLSQTILLMLMFFGACAGSTGGGIKISRILILFKSIVKEVRIMAHPRSAVKLKMNGRNVEHETVRAINVYMAAYLSIYLISLLAISVDNLDFTSNFSAVAATLNNIGPGFAKVGPMSNFSVYSDFSKWIFSLDMLIGRLEVFPILMLLSPYTWKK